MAIPQRRLGRTNVSVSLVAMGGYHLAQPSLGAEQSVRLIQSAIDRGITFLDNSWDYNGGESERRMGTALAQGGYRERAFLMTKFDGRDRRTAERQLDESLRRLRTGHVDLWQLHENIRPRDADAAFAAGGAVEAMLAARAAGKVRFLGFTGHKDPAYHLHMFDVAAQNGFTFDTVQMPLNVLDAHFRSFEHAVIPVAQRAGTAILAMKTFGSGAIADALVKSTVLDPVDLLHYGMSLPVSAVVTGIDSPEILDQAVRAAETFAPLDAAAVRRLLDASAPFAHAGAHEPYKTSGVHDSTNEHPEWLGAA